jgi:hypothetical protein
LGLQLESESPGLKFKAMMSSNMGHWDVTDMSELVEEARELVNHGQRKKPSPKTKLLDLTSKI